MAECIYLPADSPRCHVTNSLCSSIKICRSSVVDSSRDSCQYACSIDESISGFSENPVEDNLWRQIRLEAFRDTIQEPILKQFYHSAVLSHRLLESVLANQLAVKLSDNNLSRDCLYDVFFKALMDDGGVQRAIRDDLKAVKERDPACVSYVHCLLNFKGFQACQAHRVAHKLWIQGRTALALVIQSRVSEVFAMDIHPAARIGSGVVFDHGTGVVIGETAVVGNGATILHGVTLGGTGKVAGDRHPKIGDGVLIGAGTKVLGKVRVGENAKIGAGSVVLKDVPASATAVGNPARVVGLR